MERLKSNKKILAIAALILLFLILFLITAARRRQIIQDIQHFQSGQSGQNTSGAHSGHGTSAASDTALNQYLTDQDSIMTNMMAAMETTPSGNASISFLQGMIPHHEAAVDMAESYIKYGGADQELTNLAETIVETQTSEIDQMRQLIDTITASGKKDEEKEERYLEAYNAMMSHHHAMDHGSSSDQSIEQAFADGMMMHHQMAVEMAEAILEYTDDAEVLRLAETIIDTQTQEIEQMESILERVQGT